MNDGKYIGLDVHQATISVAVSDLLFPGSLIGSLIVEKLLWNGPLTITQLTILNVPIEIAINAGLWLLCAKIYRYIREHRIAHYRGA